MSILDSLTHKEREAIEHRNADLAAFNTDIDIDTVLKNTKEAVILWLENHPPGWQEDVCNFIIDYRKRHNII